MAKLVTFFFLVELVALCAADGGKVEHTFVVSQVSLSHLCKETLAIVVNGQFPGPMIELKEGDSVAVHVVNDSPYALTIHWHGVKQRLNCWGDGVGMLTQCPIQPSANFTYRFDVVGQEGTLWWHAHVSTLRATIHGALIIRPRSSYPFSMPDREIPIIIGEWWEMDLGQLDRNLRNGNFDDNPSTATINGKLGDCYNRSGTVEDNYVLDVEHGKTYLLRIINAALLSEYYLKVACHTFTVVAVDANYVKPYSTDVIAIAPGETVDALVVADAPPGRYYMVAMANQSPKPDPPVPMFVARGVVRYNLSPPASIIHSPQMPDQYDSMTSLYFHGNLTSLPHPLLPQLMTHVDEHMFIVLAAGTICTPVHGSSSCKRIQVARMNNISFQLPQTMSLLEAHYYKKSMAGVEELPARPGRVFNFTNTAMIPKNNSEREAWVAPTRRATVVRMFRYNTVVDVVFQGTAVGASDSNPMHLHGHDMFVLAQGLGNYDAARDMKRYNLVDPPLRNTVFVPRLGWAAVRFVMDNPGVWFLHCHYGFHLSMGMAVAFVVQDGPTLSTTLPPPPIGLPRCDHLYSAQ
ncbi:unnamed protein product [Alopecurus aequalis]